MEVYVTVVNDFYPLTDVTKNYILDVDGDLRSACVIIHIIIAISNSFQIHLIWAHLKFHYKLLFRSASATIP